MRWAVLAGCLQVTGCSVLFHALPIGLGNGHKGRQLLWREDLDFISWHTGLGGFQGCRDRHLCLGAGWTQLCMSPRTRENAFKMFQEFDSMFQSKKPPLAYRVGPCLVMIPKAGWLKLSWGISFQVRLGRFISSLRKCSTNLGQLCFENGAFSERLRAPSVSKHTRNCICTLLGESTLP